MNDQSLEFSQRLCRARQTLNRSSIWRWNHSPPLHRALWRVGLRVRPPHFYPFLTNFLLSALWFGLFFGALMWLLVWQPRGLSADEAIKALGLSAIVFGAFMAIYYALSRLAHRLPRRDDL